MTCTGSRTNRVPHTHNSYFTTALMLTISPLFIKVNNGLKIKGKKIGKRSYLTRGTSTPPNEYVYPISKQSGDRLQRNRSETGHRCTAGRPDMLLTISLEHIHEINNCDHSRNVQKYVCEPTKLKV